jgi:hypothetical protein
MIIEKGKDMLCMRFVNVGGYDCIEEHKTLLNKNGFVWFGKIGNKPTDRALEKMIQDKSNYILLKDPSKAYICTFETYQYDMPTDGFPAYYSTEILPNRKFSIWFKLLYITEVTDLSVLNDIVLKSSRSPILETARKSMASHFYTVTKREVVIED